MNEKQEPTVVLKCVSQEPKVKKRDRCEKGAEAGV